jgi:hypothetical protein
VAEKEPGREGSVPPPKCKAILLCERSIIEAVTRQISLIGLFEEFVVDALPGETHRFKLFLSLTDGIVGHEYTMSLEVQDLQDDRVIARTEGPPPIWHDRLAKLNVLIAVASIHVEHEGSYEIVVLADRQEVDRQRIVISARDSLDEEEEEDHG